MENKGDTLEGTLKAPVKAREPNMELIRIVAMIMVVTLHLLNRAIGGVLEDVREYSSNYFLSWTMYCLVIVAVNCFVMLSGYYMCIQRFKLKRLILLWAEMAVYYFAIKVILTIAGKTVLSPADIIKGLFPISTEMHWFVSKYAVLCMAAPFLNRFISSMDKRRHFGCLCALIAVFSLWAVAVRYNNTDFSGVGQGMSVTWFMILYIAAAYIRLHGLPQKRAGFWFLMYLFFGMLLAASKPIISFATETILGESKFSSALIMYNSPIVFIESISLFMFFRSLSIKNQRTARIICAVAPLSLGALLLHSIGGMREIWLELLHPRTFANSPLMAPYVVLCAVGTYVAAVSIDSVRQWLFRPLKNAAWPDKLQAWGERMVDKIYELF